MLSNKPGEIRGTERFGILEVQLQGYAKLIKVHLREGDWGRRRSAEVAGLTEAADQYACLTEPHT